MNRTWDGQSGEMRDKMKDAITKRILRASSCTLLSMVSTRKGHHKTQEENQQPYIALQWTNEHELEMVAKNVQEYINLRNAYELHEHPGQFDGGTTTSVTKDRMQNNRVDVCRHV